MLKEYFENLYGVYKNKGIIPAVKTFGEYLFVEINISKLNQIHDSGPASRILGYVMFSREECVL